MELDLNPNSPVSVLAMWSWKGPSPPSALVFLICKRDNSSFSGLLWRLKIKYANHLAHGRHMTSGTTSIIASPTQTAPGTKR